MGYKESAAITQVLKRNLAFFDYYPEYQSWKQIDITSQKQQKIKLHAAHTGMFRAWIIQCTAHSLFLGNQSTRAILLPSRIC